METKKNLIQTLIETLRGTNNEGSSKRATAAYIILVLVTAIVFTFCFGLYKSYTVSVPTSIHMQIVTICEYVLYSLLLTTTAALGLTNLDKWIDKIPFLKGKNSNSDDQSKSME